MNACEGGIGDFIPCQQSGGVGEKGPARGRLGLGTTSTAVWEGGLLTVGGTRVKEFWGIYPGPVGRWDRGKWPVSVEE
jgi:hypothetical protein